MKIGAAAALASASIGAQSEPGGIKTGVKKNPNLFCSVAAGGKKESQSEEVSTPNVYRFAARLQLKKKLFSVPYDFICRALKRVLHSKLVEERGLILSICHEDSNGLP